jgi:hypothetical protein
LEFLKMGNIKLLLLSVFLVGQLAFACGSTITGGGAGSTQQTNTSSPCSSSNLGAFTSGPVMPQQTPNFSPAAHRAKTCAEEFGKAAGIRGACLNEANRVAIAELKACSPDTRVLTAIPTIAEVETQPNATCANFAIKKNDLEKEICKNDFDIAAAKFPWYCNSDGTAKKIEGMN